MGYEPKTIELITIWPDNFRVVSILIPGELRLSTVGGYGTYRLASLINLGRVEKVGDALLVDSVGFTFGIPIHQIQWESSENADFNNARLSLLKRGISGRQSMKEVMDILSMMNSISKNTVEKIELSKRNVIQSKLENDGSESLVTDSALLDHFVSEKISAIWKDAALTQVAIINASNKPQMATQWSRLPRVGGFDVVSVTEQQQIENETRILFSDEMVKNGLIGRVLQRMFPLAKLDLADTSKYRAQIAIILGLDSWQWLNERESYLKTWELVY
jgi:hypothetical protein